MVRRGECVSSIAFENGYYPGTLWEAPENDDLRELRGDPNVLREGDRLFLPDKDPKTTPCETGKRHRFTRRGVPARLRVQLMNGAEPRKNAAFHLRIDGGSPIEGATDGDGLIDLPIPPNARRGLLVLDEDGSEIELSLGVLDPMADDASSKETGLGGPGVRQRLANMGFLRSLEAPDADMPAAIAMFQRAFGIEPSGILDDETVEKLLQKHDTK